jgi:FkbM family methyltransferase
MRALVSIASKVYCATPFPKVRALYFNAFLALAKNRRIVTRSDGLVFEFDLNEMIDVALFLGRFEPDVVAAIQKHCLPGSFVLDIGANIGAHTLRFARAAGPTGRVYAFEPTDFAYQKLVRNIALNAFVNVTPVHVALSDHAAKAQTVDFRASWRSDGGRADKPSVTNLERLDDWCDAHRIERIDLVKLDVDGNEFTILDGGRRTVERFCPVFLLETGHHHVIDPAKNPLRILDSFGYGFHDAKSGRRFETLSVLEGYLLTLGADMAETINLVGQPRRT